MKTGTSGRGLREIPFGRPWITDEDRAAVLEVLQGPILTHGPQGKAFEQEFADALGPGAHAVAVSSCMAALHLAYVQLGIGKGDEVVVPAQTHTATVHAVELVGATPVFVDCDPRTGNLTADRIAAAITDRTRAIGVVHFLGIPCSMPGIMDLAQKRGLKVIEDCALALGTRHQGRHVGLFGDAGCFSFYPVKHLTTGEGGMLATRHASIAKAVSLKRGFGVDRSLGDPALPGTYDVPELGFNYRMSELQAALGRSQLRRLETNLGRRKANFEILKTILSGRRGLVVLDATGEDDQSSHYCLVVVLKDGSTADRNALVAKLNRAGVGTSIYYPHPVPRLKYYREKYGTPADRYAQASRISDLGIALPCGPHLEADDAAYVAESLLKSLDEVHA